jgi:NAD(P)-dependent dehydrogenase (short-subunit alcohol dehydrogenase family)
MFLVQKYASKSNLYNVFSLLFTRSEMIDALPKDCLDNIMGKTPLKRLGDVCDIAKRVLFLASESSLCDGADVASRRRHVNVKEAISLWHCQKKKYIKRLSLLLLSN